jgi:hypothetical protein
LALIILNGPESTPQRNELDVDIIQIETLTEKKVLLGGMNEKQSFPRQ